jgi:RHH-type transcriptional regulator, rel operon repressor / antitoxin RelB
MTVNYRETDMSKALSIRISDRLAQELDSISKDTERSRSYHVQKALEAYLTDRADLQVALDRLHDTTDPVISLDEMRKRLDI